MSCQCCNGSGAPKRTKEMQAKFDELDQYIGSLDVDAIPDRRSGFLIQILHRAQHIFGYLPEEVQEFVARKLHIPRSEVYGVISFYSYFTDQPVGKFKINVCTGTACFVKGATKVLEEFKRQLKISEGQTTPDGRIFLGTLRCVGACSLAPVCMVNDRVYAHMTAEKVAGVIAACKD